MARRPLVRLLQYDTDGRRSVSGSCAPSLANRSAISLPWVPIWPGHQRTEIMPGFKSPVFCIVRKSACDDMGAVDPMPSMTDVLSMHMVIFSSGWRCDIADLRPWSAPVISASNTSRLPSWPLPLSMSWPLRKTAKPYPAVSLSVLEPSLNTISPAGLSASQACISLVPSSLSGRS